MKLLFLVEWYRNLLHIGVSTFAVSTLLLTSDALIAEKPKAEKGGKKAGHGGDYDMY